MNCKKLWLPLMVLVAWPWGARAQTAPAPDEIKRVAEYFKSGKDAGPILAELKPCLTVDTKKGSATIWECTEPVTGKVKKGGTVHAWMSWMVPKEGKYEDLTVQWLLEGTVRATQDVALNISSYAAPYYKSQTVSKTGKWEIKVLRDGKELGSTKFEVE